MRASASASPWNLKVTGATFCSAVAVSDSDASGGNQVDADWGFSMLKELYENGVSPKLLMSGDHGTEDYDEVNVMKREALAAGIPAEDVFMDHAGFSTYETIYRAKEVFGVKSAFIVTQEYHLYRALYDAINFGIDAVGVPAQASEDPGQVWRDLREVAARVKDMVYCGARPLPKYLGDPIPITGNGDVTNDK